MSKANLEKILSDISTKIENHRKDFLDNEAHVYSLSYDTLLREISYELNTIKTKVKIPVSVINGPAREYAKGVFESLKAGYKGYSIKVGGTPTRFSALIRRTAGSTDTSVFTVIQKKRVKPLNRLKISLLIAVKAYIKANSRGIGPELNDNIHDVIQGKKNKKDVRGGGLLERGHSVGGSAIEHELLEPNLAFANEIRALRTKSSVVNGILADMQFNIITNPKQGGMLRNGKLVVFIYDQSKAKNNAQSNDIEPKLRGKFQAVIKEVLDKVDFAGLETSPSVYAIATAKIGAAAKKGKLKTNINTGIANTTYKTTATEQIKSKLLTTTINESLASSMKFDFVQTRKKENRTNWSSLIPIINSKLANQVRSNMHAPRLVNRTGRFAESARVVGVTETDKGYPSFAIDYERDPYNVFDPVVGRSPWNTPERNPRALVELSVRQIVAEMAIGRFYVRRA